ncbi:MAG: ribulose-phosphate 3-epimerase [Coriobacteriales bacterium]|jgi:ribulose-phosphate 3-epimerase|nr:ribulose-phosphate 3-epimerase [Coriobacteriales bacterium]
MTTHVQIAPSLLSADFLNLERHVRLLTESAEPPEWLHIDVMDGHFVPNLTIGPPFVRALKRITTVPLDVHLMIDNPSEQLDWYLDAGADLLTLHLEAARPGARGTQKGSSATIKELSQGEVEYTHTLLARIHAAGARAGLSLNPETPTGLLLPFYESMDLVLLMSVHPGFGGQSFIPEALVRLTEVRDAAQALGANLLIEVDGGIDADTAQLAVEAGANVLVAGQAIYGQADPIAALQKIRAAVHHL